MEQEITKRVITLAEKNQDIMRQKTGISTSLEEDDVKNYLHEVLEEIKKKPRQV
jgi:hypothetical protein